MNKLSPVGLASLSLVASPLHAQTPGIEHRPVACAAAQKFPRIEASLSPADAIATARVVFQGQTKDWYSVTMKPEGSVFAGVLPQPKKDLKSFRYYIEATDKAMATNRTPEYTTAVVDSVSACKGKMMAGALSAASVVLQGPAGVAALPAGFASTGVVAGSAAAAGATASAEGGGIGATALVIGGIAIAGGAALAMAASSKGDEGSSSSNQGSTQGVRLDVSLVTSSTTATGPITTPFIDVSACRPNTTFGGGSLTLRSDGTFDETWSVSTPALRVTGRADANSLQATLSCISGGGPTGSMSANGSGYSQNGNFSFGPSQGTITVRRSQ